MGVVTLVTPFWYVPPDELQPASNELSDLRAEKIGTRSADMC
jgi:hypothetical protein